MGRGAAMSERETDRRVIEACQQGDREAFRELFETYKDKVYSIALHFTRDETAARDITQQVFLKLFHSIGQYRHDAGFTTWLYRMVANACLDEQRRWRRWVFFEDGVEVRERVERKTQEDRYTELEIAASVRAAIAELKPKLRLVILLKYFEDLSYEEMAEVLGCSMGTVASRLNRGHKILARKLSHYRRALASDQ
jgi:RNA polymerase sigma-70 factor (ECF subfamily)